MVAKANGIMNNQKNAALGYQSPADVLDALGHPGLAAPPLPGWVRAWIEADAARPWPPMQDPIEE